GWLAHARGLSFEGRQFEGPAELAASPHLAGLASLTLGRCYFQADRLAALFRDAGLRGLCRLSCAGLYMQPTQLGAVCEAPFAPNLGHLALDRIHDEALLHLTETPALAGLVTLALGISGDSGTLLTDPHHITALRRTRTGPLVAAPGLPSGRPA